LARDIVLRQLFGPAVVNANMAIDIEDGGLVRPLHHPFFAKLGAPRKGLLLVSQMLEFDTQGAHFRRTVDAKQFAPFARRIIAQRLHRFEAGQGHEGEQQKDGLETIKPFWQMKVFARMTKQPADQQRG
jgi:hypothetical protein